VVPSATRPTDAASPDQNLYTTFWLLPENDAPGDLWSNEVVYGEPAPLVAGSADVTVGDGGAKVFFAFAYTDQQVVLTDQFGVRGDPDAPSFDEYTPLGHDETDLEVTRVAAIDADVLGAPFAMVVRDDASRLTLYYPDVGPSFDRPTRISAAAEAQGHELAADGTQLLVAWNERLPDGAASLRATAISLADPAFADQEEVALEVHRVPAAAAPTVSGPSIASLGQGDYAVVWAEADGGRLVVRMACLDCAGP
jgi:hypothetical protein